MAHLVFKLGPVWCCLFHCLVCNANVAASSFETERAKHDTFRNLQCQTAQSCTKNQCRSYQAECLDDKCVRCRCNGNGRNTFLTSSDSNAGNCTKDENIIRESGCYRFQNETFMLYLDNETCHHSKPCSHQFSAPIFSTNQNCSIKWPDSKILYSVATAWQNVSANTDKQLFFIQTESNDTKILLVDQKALGILNGSLLRLAISCGMKNVSENQCLLLKFESLQWNAVKINPAGTVTQSRTTTSSNTTSLSTNATPTTGVNEIEISTTMIVVVGLACSLAVIWLVILLFVCCRRQRRHRRGRLQPNKGYNTSRDHNQPAVLVPLNEAESSSGNDHSPQRMSQIYAVPGTPQYECAYNVMSNLKDPCTPQYENLQKPCSEEVFTYDYAFIDASLKNDRARSVGIDMRERPPNTDGWNDEEYVIQIPCTEEDDTHGSDYVIECPYTERGDNDGSNTTDYVIERPYTERGDNDGSNTTDYVIEIPCIEEGDIHRSDTRGGPGGYVVPISEANKGDTYGSDTTGGYVIGRPKMEK